MTTIEETIKKMRSDSKVKYVDEYVQQFTHLLVLTTLYSSVSDPEDSSTAIQAYASTILYQFIKDNSENLSEILRKVNYNAN